MLLFVLVLIMAAVLRVRDCLSHNHLLSFQFHQVALAFDVVCLVVFIVASPLPAHWQRRDGMSIFILIVKQYISHACMYWWFYSNCCCSSSLSCCDTTPWSRATYSDSLCALMRAVPFTLTCCDADAAATAALYRIYRELFFLWIHVVWRAYKIAQWTGQLPTPWDNQ